jgi:hypothetical protein
MSADRDAPFRPRHTSPRRLRPAPPRTAGAQCAILASSTCTTAKSDMAKTHRRPLRQAMDFLHRHPLATFLLMGAFFLLFGFTSLNLYALVTANLSLILAYGATALADGALRQLGEILGTTALSIIFFVLFALCERVLVSRLTGNLHDDGGETPG